MGDHGDLGMYLTLAEESWTQILIIPLVNDVSVSQIPLLHASLNENKLILRNIPQKPTLPINQHFEKQLRGQFFNSSTSNEAAVLSDI